MKGRRLGGASSLCDTRSMTDERKQKLAADRAELYAPAPTGGSIMAGNCTGVMALLGVSSSRAFTHSGSRSISSSQRPSRPSASSQV